MNFTRDPIIETVITPREGCKLVVRSSKGANQEDYFVDALEVVSFGHSFFFRSTERPKSFLVPVSDYEIFESKEPKMALKNATADRSIKIGGGREPSSKSSREAPTPEMREEPAPAYTEDRNGSPDRMDRKRDRQRRRSRRSRDSRGDSFSPQESEESYPAREAGSFSDAPPLSEQENGMPSMEAPKEKAPSFISKLFPPPSTLIRETLSRYKTVDPAVEDMFSMTSKESESFEENASYDETPPEQQSSPPHGQLGGENGEEE